MMSQAVKDALYLTIVIILTIIFLRVIWQFGVLILIVAGAYFIYQKYFKNDNNY